MVHRRDFLRTAITGAAGAFAIGQRGLNGATAAQPSSSGRRQVMVGGRRIKVIDVHAHCVIPVGEIVKGTPLAKAGSGDGNLGPDRLKIMDQQGVDVQALTINGYWWYAADRALASKIVLAQNEGLASGCRHTPIGLSRWRRSRCSIRTWRPSSSMTRSRGSACAARRLAGT